MGLNEQLLQSIALGDVIPASLDRWRPLIVDGVLFLLQRLPPPRQAAIWHAQLMLPGTATPGQRLVALDRKSTRLNSSHVQPSRMPSSA